MLILLLPVEGTRVITSACRRIICTRRSCNTGWSHKVQRDLLPQKPPSRTSASIHKDGCPAGKLWRAKTSELARQPYSGFNVSCNTKQHLCTLQTGRAVPSHTQTHQKGIWLPTATGQLWSIANINDISASANATHFPTHEKKKKWQKYGKHNVGDKILRNSGNVQAL